MPDYNVILNAVKNLVLQPCHSERSEESLIKHSNIFNCVQNGNYKSSDDYETYQLVTESSFVFCKVL